MQPKLFNIDAIKYDPPIALIERILGNLQHPQQSQSESWLPASGSSNHSHLRAWTDLYLKTVDYVGQFWPVPESYILNAECPETRPCLLLNLLILKYLYLC